VRVRLAGIGAFGNAHGLDSIAQHRRGDILHVMEKFLKPKLKVHSVPEYKIRTLRLHDVFRRWVVAVDFGTGLGDGFHHRRIARDLTCHVGDDGETRHHALFSLIRGLS